MSKVDAQRAMREAKYARIRASGPTRREAAATEGTVKAPAGPSPVTKPDRAVEGTPTSTTSGGARCGHKSINGRACTREAAHAEKNHRYS